MALLIKLNDMKAWEQHLSTEYIIISVRYTLDGVVLMTHVSLFR